MAERVDFGDIMQAIEDQLIADGIVIASQVAWIVNSLTPHFSAEFDILLRARVARLLDMDGGSWDLRLGRYVDVHLRTLSISDPGAGNKAWVQQQFVKQDLIINSIGDSEFFPKNSQGKLLTIAPLKPISDLAPERPSDASTWGESILTLDVHYLPKVTPRPPLSLS